jgi:hypothetical protein
VYGPTITEEDKQNITNDIISRVDSQLLDIVGDGVVTI